MIPDRDGQSFLFDEIEPRRIRPRKARKRLRGTPETLASIEPVPFDCTLRLIYGDCLDRMKAIPDHSVNLILTDLPYGRTNSHWDAVIPFEPMWAHYGRILSRPGAVVLFSMQPFTSMLVMSNIKKYKFEIIWDRVNKYTDFLNARRRPMRVHENVIVFGYGKYPYNPQKRKVEPYRIVNVNPRKIASYNEHKTEKFRSNESGSGMPGTIIRVPGIDRFKSDSLHINQKPVDLVENLIRTFSNERDIVLDSCVGSGTTLEACYRTNRHGIGMENDAEIFAIARKRLEALAADIPLTVEE